MLKQMCKVVLLSVSVICLALRCSFAQTPITIKSLHSFLWATNGLYPTGSLIEGSDGYLYGVTASGSEHFHGTVFRIDKLGNLNTLHTFNQKDGRGPVNGVVQGLDGSFYGITNEGGSYSWGTVFKVAANGDFTSLHSFTLDDGCTPNSLSLNADGYLYGTTTGGGKYDHGTQFKIDTQGNFTKLSDFTTSSKIRYRTINPKLLASDGNYYGIDGQTIYRTDKNGVTTMLYTFQKNEGIRVENPPVLASNGCFYGTTLGGGFYDCGTIYRVDKNNVFTTLHTFSGPDGADSEAGLVAGKDGFLYGVTTDYPDALPNQYGTIYKCDLNGNITTLHRFNDTEGSYPVNGLLLASDGYFYGVAPSGGTDNLGVVYRVDNNGNFTVLYHFKKSDGYKPNSSLIQDKNGNMYGMALRYWYSNSDTGCIYRISPNGMFTIIHSFTDEPLLRNTGDNLVYGDDGYIYGSYNGSIFLINVNGVFRTLYAYNINNHPDLYSISVSYSKDGYLYGVSENNSKLFRLNNQGQLNYIYSFSGLDGLKPNGQLLQISNGDFYGVTYNGGVSDLGTIYKFTPPVGSFDVTAPVTTPSFTGTSGKNGWYRSAVPVSLTASDVDDAVAVTHYKLDDGSDTVYSHSFDISGEGKHTLEFWSEDVSGNVEAHRILNINIDTFAPQININIAGSKNADGSYIGPVSIGLSTFDDTSRVGSVTYSIDGNKPQDYTTTFTVRNTGTHTISFTCTDNAGNTTTQQTLTFANTYANVLHTFSKGLAMISAPVDYSQYSVSMIFSTPITIAAWNPASLSYAISPASPADTIHPATGYWVKFSVGTDLYDLGSPISSSYPTTISLNRKGWYMIGNPRNTAVALGSLVVEDSSYTHTLTFTDAVKSGLINGVLYTYQAGDTAYRTVNSQSSLQPYQGYWIYANKPCYLVFPATTPFNTKR